MSYAGPTPRAKHHSISRSPATQFSAANSGGATGRGKSAGDVPHHPYDPDLAERVSTGAAPRRRREWDSVTVFAAGIAVGLAVGVGTALLFAPQTGEEARSLILRRARRLRRRGGDAWEDLRRELSRAGRRRMKALRQAVRSRRSREEP